MAGKFSIAFLIAVAFCSGSFGQTGSKDGNVELDIFQSGEERDQFWTALKQTEDPEIKAMLPLIYDITRGKPIGTSGPWGKERQRTPMIQVLADPNVRRELEMVDDQYNELQDLSSQLQQQLAAQLRAVDLSDTEGLASQINTIRSRTREQLESVLLPHQLKRLRQISAQSQLRGRSLVDVITSDPLKSELEINDAQADQLKEAEREIEANLSKQISRLRARAREELLSKLKRSQREQVDDLFGDFFESDRSKPRKGSKDED